MHIAKSVTRRLRMTQKHTLIIINVTFLAVMFFILYRGRPENVQTRSKIDTPAPLCNENVVVYASFLSLKRVICLLHICVIQLQMRIIMC